MSKPGWGVLAFGLVLAFLLGLLGSKILYYSAGLDQGCASACASAFGWWEDGDCICAERMERERK